MAVSPPACSRCAPSSDRATGHGRLVDAQPEVMVLGGVGERADVRPALEPLGHAGDAGRDRDLVVGQTRRGELVPVDPVVAEREAGVVIALEIAVVPGVVTDELGDSGGPVVEERPDGPAVDLAAVAADEDAAGPDPRAVLVGYEVVDAQPVARIEERDDLVGFDRPFLGWRPAPVRPRSLWRRTGGGRFVSGSSSSSAGADVSTPCNLGLHTRACRSYRAARTGSQPDGRRGAAGSGCSATCMRPSRRAASSARRPSRSSATGVSRGRVT